MRAPESTRRPRDGIGKRLTLTVYRLKPHLSLRDGHFCVRPDGRTDWIRRDPLLAG
jgi:hypothetical protein